jgi:hypothetical protein
MLPMSISPVEAWLADADRNGRRRLQVRRRRRPSAVDGNKCSFHADSGSLLRMGVRGERSRVARFPACNAAAIMTLA